MITHTTARHLLIAITSVFLLLAVLVVGWAPAPAPLDAASLSGLQLETLKTIYAKALTSHACDDTEWHFVITQVEPESNAPASIQVTWANGNSETVPLSKVTGGTAHYSVYSNLDSTVTQATTQIYADWSGQFNLSHGPCGVTPTRTSTPTPTPTPTETWTPTPTPTETETPTPTPTETWTPTPTVQPLPAFCQQLGASKRAAKPGEVIHFEGWAQSGTQGYAITAYKFIFGDGSETAWIAASPPPGTFKPGASHAYTTPGRYQVQFLVRLANGQVIGGARTRCALVVTITPPPPPEPVCAERPPLFITGVAEQGRQLVLNGLSWDNAPIEIQIQGPSDADFVANGLTTADAYGHWTYTTTALGEDGVYRIRALSYGQFSENTVVYTMDGNGPALRMASFRRNVAGYSATNDTYISEQAPYISYWREFTVSVRTEDVIAPIAWFDLTSIPRNARIVMAKLGLYSLDAEPCTNMVASSYQLLRTWDPLNVTWISTTQGIAWDVPGANSTVVDRLGEPTYTETVKAPYTWYTWDVTDMVQQWVSNPSSNFGVIIKAWSYGREVRHADNDLDHPAVVLEMEPLVNGIGGRRDFAASEYAEVRRRPILYVTYVLP